MNQDSRSRLEASGICLGLALAGLAAGCGGIDQAAETTAASEEAATRSAEEPVGIVESAVGSELAGTRWLLVEFQSMDDAIGTVRPEDPGLYTMQLNADGTVNMQLNCNRASGTWSAEPAVDPGSGTFQFGPLAMTRALCQPPSMDEQIASQAEYITSFLLKDGRLYLSLMADGGIYAWEPYSDTGSGIPFLNEPDGALEAAILEAFPDYTREIVEIDGRKGRYLYGRVDLNADGEDETFVYLLGSIFCGTGGCNLLLFTGGEAGYTLINNLPISRLPVVVSSESTEGWSNLMKLESGGGALSSYLRLVFDGTRYVEGGRLPGDAEPEGTRVMVGEFTFDDGIPLEPRG